MRPKIQLKINAWMAVSVIALSFICCGNAFGRSPVHAYRDLLDGGLHHELGNPVDHQSAYENERDADSLHDEKVIGRWAQKYFPKSYAGMYIESGKVERLIVGFTERQSSRVRAAQRLSGLTGKTPVSGFPHVPKHSLLELDELQQRILHDVMQNEAHSGLIVSVGVVVQVNLVEVGATHGHVQKTRKLLKKLYGVDAPIRVRYERPPAEV